MKRCIHFWTLCVALLVCGCDSDSVTINGNECDECVGTQLCCDNKCVDVSSDSAHCGSCTIACDPGIACVNARCESKSCTPTTCEALGFVCGSADDGCGGSLNCGSCSGNQDCRNGQCVDPGCTPATCEALGFVCGSADDGCGGSLNCGSCSGNQSCQDGQCVDSGCTPTTCEALGFVCGSADDGCGGSLNCGSCSGNQRCESNRCRDDIANTYPKRKGIKGIQPDGAENFDEVAGNETHGVVMNMVWEYWQGSQHANCSGESLYDGNCFTVDANVAEQIRKYTERGIVVTAIIWGVPAWARIAGCESYKTMHPHFCAPASGKEQDFGRFAGFLAHYFNGENGHGRIADFVIHNEVNNYQWFNPGHNSLTASNLELQAKTYAASFNAAYDYVRREQKQAKVLISLDHFFGQNDTTNGSFASRDFLIKLIPQLGEREWRLAYHSYPPNLIKPVFGPDDWKDANQRITFGTLGILAAWLRQNYPTKPYTWEIQLTENGINGNPASNQAAQKQYLCQAFKNVLGTPGIESFIYHRFKDHEVEIAGGLGCGLWNADRTPKPAWETFALANRSGVASGWPACGFEFLPYIEMMRGYNKTSGMHWVTTRQFPNGFSKENSWKILREPADNTVLVYECRVGGAGGNHAMISTDVNCEGQFNMGPMGYLYQTQVSGTVPVYRCRIDKTGSHFVSSSATCENQVVESLVGYAVQ